MGTNCDDEMSDGLHVASCEDFAYSLICLRRDVLDTNARLFLMFNTLCRFVLLEYVSVLSTLSYILLVWSS